MISDLAEQVLDFKKFSAFIYDRALNELKLLSQRGFQSSLKQVQLPVNLKKSIVAKTAREGRILYIPDVKQDSSYLEFDPNVRSELSVPIKCQERVVGVLNI